jgi:hypothetical protein
MKTFNLSCKVTVSAYTEVQANSLEEAIKIAATRDVEIGGMGSGNDPDESWIIDDADGAHQEIRNDED